MSARHQDVDRPTRSSADRPPWLRLMRPAHWIKNGLLVVPVLTAQAWGEPGTWLRVAAGFVAFCCAASAAYVLNDIADIHADRAHAAKRHRPLAAGEIGEGAALVLTALLAGVAAAGASVAGGTFALVLGLYVVLAISYTRWLKRIALLDVLALSALWVLRLVAGAAIVQVVISTWLLSFGAFLFLSLGLVKRCEELRSGTLPPDRAVPGRAYRGADLGALQSWGIATGAAAVVVLALFVDSTSAVVRYTHPERLWLVCACVWFWLGRVWLLTGRGEMHSDPIAFALRDPASWATLAVIVASWIAALLPY